MPQMIILGAVVLMLLVALVAASMAGAQEQKSEPTPPTPTQTEPEPDTKLAPVLVTAPPLMSSSSEQMIPGRDFELRPHGRPADVLRLIPGLIINQHQGGGKAEQYLIRGFDADHGTDLAIFVDNLPVNMRSHAHGQGYADLHFLIPETVRAVDVLKGPYFAEYGDFDTAGVVNFITRDFVEENTLEISGGSFNTQRYLALLSPTKDQVKTFLAIEGYHSDGPFDTPQRLSPLQRVRQGQHHAGRGHEALAVGVLLSRGVARLGRDPHARGALRPHRPLRLDRSQRGRHHRSGPTSTSSTAGRSPRPSAWPPRPT